jgi:hypothetical protein
MKLFSLLPKRLIHLACNSPPLYPLKGPCNGLPNCMWIVIHKAQNSGSGGAPDKPSLLPRE